MPASTLEKLLNDKDQGVLLTALNRVSSNARNQEIIDRIEELANHPSRGIRLKVVDVARIVIVMTPDTEVFYGSLPGIPTLKYVPWLQWS